MIDLADLVRDRVNVKKALKIVGDELIAMKDLKICIPYRFFNRRLASLGETIMTSVVFAVVVGDTWDLMMTPAMISLTPEETTVEVIDDEDFMVLSFSKNSVVSPNVNMVRSDQVAWEIYDGFYGSGYKPWYIWYDDYSKLLALATKYSGINLGPNNVPHELVVAQISKDAKDRSQVYRGSLRRGYVAGSTTEPYVTPLQSVLFGANNVATQLVGAYLRDGVLTAMTYPSTKSEPIEELLRS